MAKRRHKKRTHAPQPNPAEAHIPQSMVLRIGGSSVGASLSQLVHDVRMIMQPHTAVKLRERKANKLRDYLSMAGPLGVTHLLMFSKTQSNETSLRIAHTPRGPTVHFKVQSYSLCNDLRRVQKHPYMPDMELQTSPLLVLNGFAAPASATTATDKAHLTLLTSMFQNMFPAITASAAALKKIKRVMLINFEQETGELDMRHYLISTKTLSRRTNVAASAATKIKKEEEKDEEMFEPAREDNDDEINDRDMEDDEEEADDEEDDENEDDDDDDEDEERFLPHVPSGVSRTKLQKLLASKKRLSKSLPRLGKTKDIADFLLRDDAGEMSAVSSESEAEDDDMFDDSILHDARSRRSSSGEKKAVKLIELGPRIKLKLVKIQEGVCEGAVLYHAYKATGKLDAKK
ncbi:Brix domain-containing protein [Lipomyces orientalis]|uniref:Brix domain-containing protein n=1 Tax=Lipomyces orientalis TaxID=1233043 RepID=A0ACC3TX48_9ASCO